MDDRSSSCIFCQIIEGSERSSEIYRDEYCIAFLDLNPINPGHTLVCPVRHVTTFVDINAQEMQAVVAVAQSLARAQRQKLANCLGVNLILSDGAVAGQEVSHAHFHVVPRSENDGFGWRRSGKAASRKELDLIAAQLRE